VTNRKNLVFVSTRFLFPADSGGKIRTTQVLRGLKGGRFRITLLMPASDAERAIFEDDIDAVCDDLVAWSHRAASLIPDSVRKVMWLFAALPVPVCADLDVVAAGVVAEVLGSGPDVVVFDFPHSAVLAPSAIQIPSVLFTHNIEAEIFKRHWHIAGNPLHRAIWKSQYQKMLAFERQALAQFDAVIAVSNRDSEFFKNEYGVDTSESIPTGVDTEFFAHNFPQDKKQVVFCGSMDWMANIDGIEFFHDEVWQGIRDRVPGATMKVVGRAPPDSLVNRIAKLSPDWTFTGFVEDVRDHVSGADVFVIPLRVGGGTRIKAFEAMAMGCPVVSTSIGIEGLAVEDGVHYLCADDRVELEGKVIDLLTNTDMSTSMSQAARTLVEEKFGFRRAGAVFESICLRAAEG
jgi:glycosyltransferase involved in cell wall biosynthesis